MLLSTLGCMLSLQTTDFVFSLYMPCNGIAGSYGNSIFKVFQGTPILLSIVAAFTYLATKHGGGFYTLFCLQHLLFVIFLMAILSVSWYLIVILLFISANILFIFFGAALGFFSSSFFGSSFFCIFGGFISIWGFCWELSNNPIFVLFSV